MMQSGERSERGFEAAERAGTVFVSASAADARAFREIVVGSRWLVVNVPDLTGAHAAIDKLRPRLVVCDTKIEGRGSWRDLLKLKGRDSGPSFALVVVSRHAGEALWAEVRNLGGFGVLEKPLVAEEVERIVALSLLGRSSPATACALGSQPLHNGNRTD